MSEPARSTDVVSDDLIAALRAEAAVFLKNALAAGNGFDAEMDDATSCLFTKAADELARISRAPITEAVAVKEDDDA